MAATYLEIDELITSGQQTTLCKRLRTALRIHAQFRLFNGTTAAEKAWAKDALINTNDTLMVMLGAIVATPVISSAEYPYEQLTDAQLLGVIEQIVPEFATF